MGVGIFESRREAGEVGLICQSSGGWENGGLGLCPHGKQAEDLPSQFSGLGLVGLREDGAGGLDFWV